MLFAYRPNGRKLERLDTPGDLAEAPDRAVVPPDAMWIDLYRPLAGQIRAVEAMGTDVPTLDDMEEIEISNRLYHEEGADFMTVVLPGSSASGHQMSGPVTFILTPERLVTVRHHAPRPFETFPQRAAHSSSGCSSPERIFLGLCEDIIARLADLLEAAGKALDDAGHTIFGGTAAGQPELLQSVLEALGRQGEVLARVRLGLMTLERALSFYGTGDRQENLKILVKAMMRDLSALAVHSDFLGGRVGLMVDATLGMINLSQNSTVRIISVVAALFLPPTLVASAWGMNFEWMPWLHQSWGYGAVLALMLVSALGTYLVFKWKNWL